MVGYSIQSVNVFKPIYRGRPSFTSVSFLIDEDKRFNTGWRQQFCPCEKSTKELSILMSLKRRLESLPASKNHQGLGDSEDESDAKIFSVPDSETGQQSSPHIQLKLMRRQPQQGNAERVLVKNNFDTTSVTWQSKFSAVLLQRYLPVYTELKLFSITQTWMLSKLSDQDWISFVW